MLNNNIKSVKFAKQDGFTLIELMVGLVIGLIASLVISQVFLSFEGRKRVTTGAADTQTNGSIGLYNIQRDVQSAGYGIPILDGTPGVGGVSGGANNSALLCAGIAGAGLQVPSESGGLVSIFPVVINDAVGQNVSDSITIRRGTTEFGGISTGVAFVAGTDLTVGSNLGCEKDSILLYIDGPGSCAATKVTQVTGANQIRVANATGISNNPTSKVSCIGEFYEEVTFSVVNNQLVRTDRNNPAGVPIISDIVNMQAQYGLSNAGTSNEVTSWVDTVTSATRNRVRAVRVAVIARSGKRENNVVSFGCGALNTANPQGLCTWGGTPASPAPNIDLQTATPDWNHYRYRVYEAIIPLRNLTFAGTVL